MIVHVYPSCSFIHTDVRDTITEIIRKSTLQWCSHSKYTAQALIHVFLVSILHRVYFTESRHYEDKLLHIKHEGILTCEGDFLRDFIVQM